jgi:hypothetical protein
MLLPPKPRIVVLVVFGVRVVQFHRASRTKRKTIAGKKSSRLRRHLGDALAVSFFTEIAGKAGTHFRAASLSQRRRYQKRYEQEQCSYNGADFPEHEYLTHRNFDFTNCPLSSDPRRKLVKSWLCVV